VTCSAVCSTSTDELHERNYAPYGRLVHYATGIDRGWDAAYRLVSMLDPPGQGRSPA